MLLWQSNHPQVMASRILPSSNIPSIKRSLFTPLSSKFLAGFASLTGSSMVYCTVARAVRLKPLTSSRCYTSNMATTCGERGSTFKSIPLFISVMVDCNLHSVTKRAALWMRLLYLNETALSEWGCTLWMRLRSLTEVQVSERDYVLW